MPSLHREVVHVAIGDAACGVSAHWLNLQGLAGTGRNAVGTAGTTHAVHDRVYVPRAVLIGSGAASNRNRRQQQQQRQQADTNTATQLGQQPAPHPQQQQPQHDLYTWSGGVETVQVAAPPHSRPDESAQKFREQAANLAYSSYSRYRVPQEQQQQKQSYASTGRHVNWDAEDEEDEGDEEEDEDAKARQQAQWQTQYRPTQDALEDFWSTAVPSSDAVVRKPTEAGTVLASAEAEPTTQQATPSTPLLPLTQLSWRDYLMPPYHPLTCIEPPRTDDFLSPDLESSSLSSIISSGPSYYAATTRDAEWIETVVWERLRKLLEDCDACQGLVLVESARDDDDGGAGCAGWGTALLREWHDECPHTCRWVIDVQTRGDAGMDGDKADEEASNGTASYEAKAARLNRRQRKAVRDQIQQALVLGDQTELSDVYMPIQLPGNDSASAAAVGAAAVGAALESATLPYRFSGGSCRSQLALQSYYSGSYSGSNPFGSAPNLSYREFIRTMQRQSAARNVLELDAVLPWTTASSGVNGSLYAQLQQGTSLERDQRMRQAGYGGGIHRPLDVLPGEWMNQRGGILSSLSPTLDGPVEARHGDRSLHHHFALSTSLRPTASPPTTKSDYVTCIMESMGIRFRPEQSLCAVVDQSLHQLTADGYGAGSYWKSIFSSRSQSAGRSAFQAFSLSSVPVLAVVGNTTRIYPYLHQTAVTAQQIVAPRNRRSANRALYNRDAAGAILPDVDDCHEAISACLDLRDSYEPPEGSGLVVDEEGDYFDMS